MIRINLEEVRLQKEDTYLGTPSGDVIYLSCQERVNTDNLDQELFQDESVQSNVQDNGDASSTGFKSGEITLPVQLAGTGDALTGTEITDYLHDLLTSAMGGGQSAPGTLVEGASSTTTDVDITATEGADFQIGDFVMINHELRIITGISTDTLTLFPPLSTAPSDGDVVTGSFVNYIADVDRDTYQIEIHKEGTKNSYRISGASLRPEFANLSVGEGKAMLNLMANIGDWEPITGELATDNAPNAGALPGVVQKRGKLVLSDGATDLDLHVNKVDVSPIIQEARFQAGDYAQGKGEPVLIANREFRLTLTVGQGTTSDDPLQQLRDWKPDGDLKMFYQVGHVAGSALGFYFPMVRVDSTPVQVDVDGLMGIEVELKVTIDRDASDLTSSMYIARA